VGYHQVGYHQVGYHQVGYHQVGYHQVGYHQVGYHQVGYHQVGYCYTYLTRTASSAGEAVIITGSIVSGVFRKSGSVLAAASSNGVTFKSVAAPAAPAFPNLNASLAVPSALVAVACEIGT
jgi:hypothetical protein